MGQVSLKLTPEQMRQISSEMDLVADSILVSLNDESVGESKSLICMSHTWTIFIKGLCDYPQ